MSEDVYIGAPPRAPKPPKRRTNKRLIALGVAAIALVAAGVAVGIYAIAKAKPGDLSPNKLLNKTMSVSGDVTLTDGFGWDSSNNTCWGRRGYDDMHGGAQVVVSDEAGKTIALGKLWDGAPKVSGDRATGCVFTFILNDVPTGADFYGIEIGHRGKLQYSAADIRQPLHLSLG